MAIYIKKNKASNFSSKEIERLNELVAKYSAVIFNRKTDSRTNKQKIEVWNRIAAEFNSNKPGPIARSASQLKFKFANLKRVGNTEWSGVVVQDQRKMAVGGGDSSSSDVSEIKPCLEETSLDCDDQFDQFMYSVGYPVISSNPNIELILVNEADAEADAGACSEQEDEVMCAEEPIIQRKMAGPLLTGSKRLAVTPAMLRKNLSAMAMRKVAFLKESQEVIKRKEAREAELHQFNLRKAVAECMAAEALQRSAEAQERRNGAQQELAELLLKKEKEK